MKHVSLQNIVASYGITQLFFDIWVVMMKLVNEVNDHHPLRLLVLFPLPFHQTLTRWLPRTATTLLKLRPALPGFFCKLWKATLEHPGLLSITQQIRPCWRAGASDIRYACGTGQIRCVCG